MRWLVPVALVAVAPQLPAADKPVPTKDAAAKMTVPEGFRVTLFAGEPDIVQPIAFTFDARGRMWVIECVTYPKWVQPGQKGKDRVVILEDTDGDGTHDKKTVVIDDGVNLSGIEVGFGGVYLCSTPNLIFVPIKDDKPAGPPEVLLDGWNLKDAKHNVFNGLAWGPDGWLYGCNGIQTKSWVGKPGNPDGNRTYLDCGVWRYHPTRKVFEVVAHGTTNPWGLDWDENGEMFITNCVIDHLWHIVPSGHYQRMYGQDPKPYVFGLMGPCSDHKHWGGGHWTEARADLKTGAVKKSHDDAGGGHAHSGCAIYLGDNFPAEYRNCVFTCNIHGNRLNRDTLHRTKAGYVGKHAPDFLLANDPWFRGICVKQGPEGALYVSDWTDTGECHNYDKADTSNGRIYRVTYGSPKPFRGDVAAMPDAELVKRQLSKNEWLVRQTRRVLQERMAAGKLGDETVAALKAMLKTEKEAGRKLRAIWALTACGVPGAGGEAFPFTNHENEALRAWAFRTAIQIGGYVPFDKLADRIAAEQSEYVRLHIVSALIPPDGTLQDLIPKALGNPTAAKDPNLAWMLWYLLEDRLALTLTDHDIHRHLSLSTPLLRRNTARLLVSQAPYFGEPRKTIEEIRSRLAKSDGRGTTPEWYLDVLTGVREALSDRRGDLVVPPNWLETFRLIQKTMPREVVAEAEAVGVLLGDARTIEVLLARVSERTDPASERRAAIALLLSRKHPKLAAPLRALLDDRGVRGAAIRALAAYPDADTPAAILKAYPALTADEKTDAVLTLASRPAFALALLDAVEKGAVPKADVSVFAARQILALNDKDVNAKLATAWGTIRPASATRTEQAKKIKAFATPELLKKADPSNGRAVYVKACAACHKLFGEGGDVGPELTGSQRANLDYVLENVLDPNAVVPFDYKMTAFYLHDGRVVTGQVRKETPQAVTVRTANEEVVVAVADIERRKPTNESVMPEGLLDALKEDEVRDLIAYLASPKQVPPK